MHQQHRERMRKKLMTNGDLLEEHELLEILLYYALPRKNTNDIAHSLISSFGSLNNVLKADPQMLMQIEGIGETTAAYLTDLGIILEKCVKVDEFPEIFSYEQIREPLIKMFGGINEEVFVAFFLDAKQRIIGKHIVSDHVVNKVKINLAEFSKKLIMHKPHFVAIAHNHLSGICSPTQDDDDVTGKLCTVCKIYGVNLVDHLIVAKNEVYSYYYENRIDEIKNTCEKRI